MYNNTIDLYGYFGLERCGAQAGTLTCWIPETSREISLSRKTPAVLILPGGGYEHTSAREAEPVALCFAAAGYAAFVLHYSVAPSRFPVALREAVLAMRYIRERASEFSVNPHAVAAIGFSAGGHLCGCLGTLYDSAEVADLGDAQLLRPDALGMCYPVVVSWGRTHDGSFENLCGADSDLRQRLSLERLVRSDMPPVFLWHTRNDNAVPCRNSLLFAEALEEKGVDFALHIYRTGKHGLSVADARVYPARDVPVVSWDVPQWPQVCMRYFEEIGFKITDC